MPKVNIEKIIPVTEARDSFNKMVDDVENSDELYVLTKNGKPAAVVVGVNHLEKITGETHQDVIAQVNKKTEIDNDNLSFTPQTAVAEPTPMPEEKPDMTPAEPAPSDVSEPAPAPSSPTPQPAVEELNNPTDDLPKDKTVGDMPEDSTLAKDPMARPPSSDPFASPPPKPAGNQDESNTQT